MPKLRTGISIDSELLRDCDRRCKETGVSRSDLIEQALRFYLATRTIEHCSDALVPALAEYIAAASDKGFTKVSKGLFRYAVEVEMLILLLAKFLHVDEESLDTLRRQAINHVRRTRGKVELDTLCALHGTQNHQRGA